METAGETLNLSKALLVLGLFLLVSAPVIAGATRGEAQAYLIGTASRGCPPASLQTAVVCFPILTNEDSITIQIQEQSALRHTGLPVGGSLIFLPPRGPEHNFCHGISEAIPAGSTLAIIEVHHGSRNGFCTPFGDDYLVSVRGVVNATFG